MNRHHENGGSRSTRAAAKRIGRVFLPICLLALIAAAAIGGTAAYIASVTGTVQNTFTIGNVKIQLKETKYRGGNDYDGIPALATVGQDVKNQYPLVPGKKYTKDPVVTVLSSETNIPVHIFVEVIEEGNVSTYMDYTLTLTEVNGWTQGDGSNFPTNVWHREFDATKGAGSWNLLEGNTITVNSSAVTEETMAAAKNATLSFRAYAIQQESLTAKDAWAAVK